MKSLQVLTGKKKCLWLLCCFCMTFFYADMIGNVLKCRQSPEYSLMGNWWAVKLIDKDTTCKFINEKPCCTVAYKQTLIHIYIALSLTPTTHTHAHHLPSLMEWRIKSLTLAALYPSTHSPHSLSYASRRCFTSP